MSKRLLLRTPARSPMESPLGYLLRVSESNHYKTPWYVFQLAGYQQSGMISAALTMDKLAALVNQPLAELESASYTAREDDGSISYRINGHHLGKTLASSPFDLKRPKVCIACLEEGRRIDMCWDLSVFLACPDHACMLTSACGACGQRLSWFRPGALTCRCGKKLEAKPEIRASAGVLTVAASIRDLVLCGDSDSALDVAKLQAPLSSPMTLRALLGFIERVAQRAPERSTRQDAIEYAGRCLEDWPRGFHREIPGLLAATPCSAERGSTTLVARFTALHDGLFCGTGWGDALEEMRIELVRFGLATGKRMVDRRLVRDDVSGALPLPMSIARIAEMLGVMPSTAAAWIRRGLVPSLDDGVPAELVDLHAGDLQRQFSNRLNNRRASAYVGLPVSVLVGLKASGRYANNAVVNARVGYWKGDLEALRSRILDTVTLADEPPVAQAANGGEVVTLGRIMKFGKGFGEGAKTALLVAILDGRVKPRKRNATSIDEIQLLASEANSVMHEALRETGCSVSLLEARRLLGCHGSTVSKLVEMGVLTVIAGRILRESLRNFSAKWLTEASFVAEYAIDAGHLATCVAEAPSAVLAVEKSFGNYERFLDRSFAANIREQKRLEDERNEEAQRSHSDIMGLRAAAAYIKLPPSVLRGLKMARAYSERASLNERAGYWEEDLEDLSQRILRAAQPDPNVETQPLRTHERVVSLSTVMRYGGGFGPDAKTTLIIRILSGQLKAVSDDARSKCELRFRANELNAVLAESIANVGDLMMVRAAGLHLRCRTAAVTELARQGLLERNGTCLTKSSVTAFSSKWVSLAGATEILELPIRAISRRVQSLGKDNVLSVAVPEGKVIRFFLRSAIQVNTTMATSNGDSVPDPARTAPPAPELR